MKLEKDLYAYVWENPYENNCNTYVIQGDRTILIDPGHSRHIGKLLHQMEIDGIPSEGIDLIIATHSHPDHLEGFESFLGKPVKMVMSREEERYLMGSGRALFEMMGCPLPEIRIDFYLNEGEVHIGKQIFEIYETPGHSPGSLSIYWPEKKALFTGDVLFKGGVGRTDFPEGDGGLLKESIERLSRLETEILLPGHGEIVMGREMVLENFEFIRQSFSGYL